MRRLQPAINHALSTPAGAPALASPRRRACPLAAGTLGAARSGEQAHARALLRLCVRSLAGAACAGARPAMCARLA